MNLEKALELIEDGHKESKEALRDTDNKLKELGVGFFRARFIRFKKTFEELKECLK